MVFWKLEAGARGSYRRQDHQEADEQATELKAAHGATGGSSDGSILPAEVPNQQY